MYEQHLVLHSLNYKKIILRSVLLIGGLIAVYSGFIFWKNGTHFGPPCFSPNHEYYVQHYQNFNWLGFISITMPGQAGDNHVGYTRLFDKKGNLLHERFGPLSEESMPYWLHNEVFFIGENSETWRLPTSAGIPGATYKNNKMGECY